MTLPNTSGEERHVARSEHRLAEQGIRVLAVMGNLKQWLLGTHHGVSRAQLQAYLDEFVFRHNRRSNRQQRFRRCWASGPATRPCLWRSSGEPPIYRSSR